MTRNPYDQFDAGIKPPQTASANPYDSFDTPNIVKDMSWLDKLLTGVGSGMVGIGQGIEQRLRESADVLGIGDENNKRSLQNLQQQVSERRQIMEPLKKDSPFTVGAGEMIGEAAPMALVPGGVAGGFLKRLGTSALAGAAVGAAQPTTQDESVAWNTFVGGMGGAGGSAALSGAGKIWNAVANKLPPNFTQALADKYGVRVTLGEATNNPHIQRAETWLERIPLIGLKGYREARYKEADEAAKRLLSNYIFDPSASNVSAANRKHASSFYEALKSKVKDVGEQNIIPSETQSASAALLKQYPDVFKKLQNTKLEKVIQEIAGDTESTFGKQYKQITVPGMGQPSFVATVETPATGGGFVIKTGENKYYTSKGAPVWYRNKEEAQRVANAMNESEIQKVTSPVTKMVEEQIENPAMLSFQDVWTLRQGLGDLIGRARKKIASGDIDNTELSELSKLFGAVNKDIDNWASSIGRQDIKEAITVANDAYKHYVVKYDIIQRAYDKASGVNSAKEMFSPKTFSTELKKIIYKDQNYNRLFNPTEIDEMAGTANILQVVKRAGQYMENPPTGDRWGVPIIGIGGAKLEPHTTAALASATVITRFLTGTEPGKKLALAASKIEPTNPNMKVILKMIYNQIPKFAGAGAAGEQ